MIGKLEMPVRKINFGHMTAYTSTLCDRTRFDGRRVIPWAMTGGALGVIVLRALHQVLVWIVTGNTTDAFVIDRGVIAFASGQAIGLEPDVVYVTRAVGRDFLPRPMASAAEIRLFLDA